MSAVSDQAIPLIAEEVTASIVAEFLSEKISWHYFNARSY